MIKALFLKQAFYTCWLLLIILGFNACKTRKATQPAPSVNAVIPMDADSVQDLLNKLDKYSFKAQWMSAKADVVMVDSSNETSFSISLRMLKDSVIWISASPLLGIEVARVMITPDSVKVLDRLHGKYQSTSFEYINKLLQMKVNFESVQALLLGNFFAYKRSENKFNSVYVEDKYFVLSSLTKRKLKRSLEEKDANKAVIQDCYISPELYRILTISVEDQKINKKLLTHYSDFRQLDAGAFPYKSETHISADKVFDIKIEFTKVQTGEPQEFPFTIPPRYEKIH